MPEEESLSNRFANPVVDVNELFQNRYIEQGKAAQISQAALQKKQEFDRVALNKAIKTNILAATPRSAGETAQDFGAGVANSAIGLGQMAYGAADVATRIGSFGNVELDDVVSGISQTDFNSGNFDEARAFVSDTFKSDQLKASIANVAATANERAAGAEERKAQRIAEGKGVFRSFIEEEGGSFVEGVKSFAENPIAAVDAAVESVLQLPAAGAVGKAAITAFGKATVKKMGTKKAGEYLATEAGKKAVQKTAERAGIGYVAASEGLTNAVSAKGEVQKLSHAQLLEGSPAYAQLLAEGNSQAEAKVAIANSVFDTVALIAGTTGAVASKLTGAAKFEGNLFNPDSALSKIFLTNAVKKIAVGAGTEGAEETLQGASGEFASNLATREFVDKDQELSEGIGHGAAASFVAGSLSGAAVGGVSAIPDIVRAPSEIAKEVKKGVTKVSEAVTTAGLDKEVKAAVKSGDVTELTKPVDIATALLHKDNIPEDVADIPEHINKIEPQLDSIKNDLDARAKTLNEENLAVTELQKTLTENSPEAETTAFGVRYKALVESTAEFNKELEGYKSLKGQLDILTTSRNTQEQVSANRIAEKLERTLNPKTTEDGLASVEEDVVEETLEEAITATEAKTLLGSSAFDSTNEEALAHLESIEGIDESTKDQIKLFRALNSSEVSTEIKARQVEGTAKGLREHLIDLKRNPSSPKFLKQYENFKEKVLGKIADYTILKQGLTDESVKDTPEYKAAYKEFNRRNYGAVVSEAAKAAGATNGTQARLNAAYLNKTLNSISKEDYQAFELADTVLTGFGVSADSLAKFENIVPQTAADVTGTSAAVPGTEASSEVQETQVEPEPVTPAPPTKTFTQDGISSDLVNLSRTNPEQLSERISNKLGKTITVNRDQLDAIQAKLKEGGRDNLKPGQLRIVEFLENTQLAKEKAKDAVTRRNNTTQTTEEDTTTDGVQDNDKVAPEATDDTESVSSVVEEEATGDTLLARAQELKLRIPAAIRNNPNHKKSIKKLKAKIAAEEAKLAKAAQVEPEVVEDVIEPDVVVDEVLEPELDNITVTADNPNKTFFDRLGEAALLSQTGFNYVRHGVKKSVEAITKPLTEYFKFGKASIFLNNDNLFADESAYQEAIIKQLDDKNITSWEHLSDEQSTALTTTFKYVNAFIAQYNKGPELVITANDLKFLDRDPSLYFVVAGTDSKGNTTYRMPQNVIAAMALSSLEFMNNSAEELIYPDTKRMEKLLGERSYTDNDIKLFDNSGLVGYVLADNLGNTFTNVLGMSDKQTTLINQMPKMRDAIGKRTISTMLDMKLIEPVLIPSSYLNLAQSNDALDNAELGAMTGIKDSYTAEDFEFVNAVDEKGAFIVNPNTGKYKTVPPSYGKEYSTFYRPVTKPRVKGQKLELTPLAEKAAGVFNNTESLGHKIFTMSTVETFPTWKPPTELQETVKRGLSRVPKRAAKISLEASKHSIKLNKGMFNLMQTLGRKNIIDLLVTPLEDRAYPNGYEGVERSKHDQQVRAIDKYLEFTQMIGEQENEYDTEFWLGNTNWTNARVGVAQNSMDWQGDKFVSRHVMQYSDNQVEVDPNAKPEANLGFQVAVMQALGVDVDKMTTAAIIDTFNQMVSDVENKVPSTNPNEYGLHQQVDAIGQLQTGELFDNQEAINGLTPILETIFRKAEKDGSFSDKTEPLHKVNGLIALHNYMKNEPFTTDIFYEVDGITNGFAITLLQMPTTGVPIPAGQVANLANLAMNNFAALSTAKQNAVRKLYNKGLSKDEVVKPSHITAYNNGTATESVNETVRNFLLNQIEGELYKERLARTGVFTQDHKRTNSGDFNADGNNDSYKDLTDSSLQKAESIKEAISDKEAFEDIAVFARNTYDYELYQLKDSRMSPSAKKKKALFNATKSLNDFKPNWNFIKFLTTEKAVEKRIPLHVREAGAKLLERQGTISEEDLTHMAVMAINNMSIAELGNRNISPNLHQKVTDLMVATEGLMSPLHDKDKSGKDEFGVMRYAVNSAGRALAKPSLLISNYGASIDNIVRTYASNLTEEIEYNLVKLQKEYGRIQEDSVEAAAERKVLQRKIITIRRQINALVGNRMFASTLSEPQTLAEFNTVLGELATTLDFQHREHMIQAISQSYGQVIKQTLNDRYGDMFEARSKLNNTTQLTYELFTRYRDEIIQKYKNDNNIPIVNGSQILNKKQMAEIDEKLINVTPFYKTFFSVLYNEGVYGPVSKEVQQVNRPVLDVDGQPERDEKGNVIMENNTAFETRVNKGVTTTLSGHATMRETSNPGVRIGVMLTHAIDGAVQQRLQELLSELDDKNYPLLNIHDAAAFRIDNPELYTQIYNQAYLEIMKDYSLPSAIIEPLNRIMGAVSSEFPHIITDMEKVGASTTRISMGKGLLPPFLQGEPKVGMIYTAALNAVEGMNQKKEDFFMNNTIHATQYAIGSFKGAKMTPQDITDGGGLNKLHVEPTRPVIKMKVPIPTKPEDDSQGSSSTSSIDINNFGIHTQVPLNSGTVISEFDKLDNLGHTQDTPQHKQLLREIISNVIAGVVDDVAPKLKLSTRTKGESAEGKYNPAKGVFLNIPEPNTSAPNFSAAMSAQETYVHEMVHAIILKALDSVPALLKRAHRLRNEVLRSGKVSPAMFMNPNLVAGTPDYDAELEIATDRFNYIFHNTNTHEKAFTDPTTGKVVRKNVGDGIHEFMTFAVTNAALIQQMNQVDITNTKEVNKNATLFEKAMELFNKMLNFFKTRVLGQDTKTSAEIARTLFNDLAVAHTKNSTKFDPNVVEKAAGKVNKIYGSAVDVGLNVTNMAVTPIARLLGKPGAKLRKVTEEDVEAFSTGVRGITSVMGAEHDSFVKSLIHELSPRSRFNSFLHTALRVKNKNIDKAIQKVSVSVMSYVNEQFNNSLSKEDKKDITRGVLRTDLQSVSDHYSIAELADIFQSQKKRSKEIRDLTNKIKSTYGASADFYTIMSKNLGRFMTTGAHRGKAMHLNAHNIANLKESGLTPDAKHDLAQAVKDIDRLATLYSINDTNLTSRESVARLLRDFPEGMDKVIKVNKLNAEDRLTKLFNNNPAQMIKGYVRDGYSSHTKFRVGDLADEAVMNKEGYYLENKNNTPIAKDAADPGPAKHLYVNRYADISERQSGAFSLIDNHTKGAFLDAKHLTPMMTAKRAAFRDIAAGIDQPLGKRENPATPITDKLGNVLNYRYTMNNATKESLLEADIAYDTVLARMETHTIAKRRTPLLNKRLLTAAHETFNKTAVPNRATFFKAIGPKESGKYKEYWDLLPEQTKKDARSIWGEDKIYLPVDGITLAMGQAKWSTQSINKVDITNQKSFKLLGAHVNNIASILLNRPNVHLAESLVREGVGFVKDTIVIRTGTVLMGNQVSNMITLKLRGIPVRTIIQDEAKAIKYAKEYSIVANKIMQNSIELRSNNNLTKNEIRILEAENIEYRTELSLNPVAELMDAGVHQTIVEDINSTDDSDANMGRAEKALKNNFIIKAFTDAADSDNKIAKGIKIVGSELLMTHNSAAYKFLKDGTQLSDFAARYVLHEHNKRNGMSVVNSISNIEDAFINYDLPTHPFLQAGNDLGFLLFTKFFFRIQPVLIDIITRDPNNVLALLLIQSFTGVDPEDIYESMMSVSALMAKFTNPIELGMDMMNNPLILNLLRGVF